MGGGWDSMGCGLGSDGRGAGNVQCDSSPKFIKTLKLTLTLILAINPNPTQLEPELHKTIQLKFIKFFLEGSYLYQYCLLSGGLPPE